MNKKTIPAIITAVLGIVICLGSQTFLGACVHEDGSFGACHWASRALMGLGGLSTLLSVLALLLPSQRSGLYLAQAASAALGILTPGTLIALCGMATMRCRMVMKPAMTVLFALTLAVAIVGFALSRGKAQTR